MGANVFTLSGTSPDERRRQAETASRVRFIRARRANGWTQLACSQWLGVSVDAVELWERGKRRVPGWALCLVEESAARRAA